MQITGLADWIYRNKPFVLFAKRKIIYLVKAPQHSKLATMKFFIMEERFNLDSKVTRIKTRKQVIIVLGLT